ncbi:MAG: methyltransferase domain-containing protein [Rhizobacter sp.]|nr:methyltransferase domain-containing protein [Ferruginibacter sp.]
MSTLTQDKIVCKNVFGSDKLFDQLYPSFIQLLAKRHWTPIAVAEKAANFLGAEDNVRVLDIGSGVGKFCLMAAHLRPKASFHGIEQRKSLIGYAQVARETTGLNNTNFINGNFTQIDFRKYDHFYFYNSFYENIVGTEKIDSSIEYSWELYNYYNRYLYKQLEMKPTGTRIASYHSMESEIPLSYHVVGSEMQGLLKFWIKI